MSQTANENAERFKILKKLKEDDSFIGNFEIATALVNLTHRGEIISLTSLARKKCWESFSVSLQAGDDIFKVVSTKELDIFIDKLKEAVRGISSEFIFSKTIKPFVLFRFQPVFNNNNEIDKIQLIIEDAIESSSNKEDAIFKKRSNILHSLFHNHPDAVYSFDLRGQFISLNNSAAQLAETTAEELLGRSFLPFIPADEKPEVFVYFEQAAQGQELNYNTGFITAKGSRKILNVTNFPIRSSGEIIGIFGIARDITESEKNKRQIKKNRQRLKTILDQSLDLICTIDGDHRFHEVSAASDNILGYKPEELIGENLFDLIYAADIKKIEIVTAGLKAGKEKTNFSGRFIRKDGKIIYTLWSAKWNAEERLMYCVCKDASEIKEAEKKLLQERRILKAIIDNIPDLIFVLDKDNKTLLTNKTFYFNYLGKESEKETLEITPFEYLPKNQADSLLKDNNCIMESGNPVINRKEIVYDHKGNKEVVLLTKVPLRTNEDRVMGLVAIGRNVTEAYSYEEEQKLLYDLVHSLGASGDLETAFTETISIISNHFGFSAAEAWEIGYSKSHLHKKASYSNSEIEIWEEETTKRFRVGEDLPGKTLELEIFQLWLNLHQDKRFLRKQMVKNSNITLAIGVPVIFKDEVLAVLTFFGRKELLREYDIPGVLNRITIQISAEIKRKITESQLNNMFLHSPNLIAVIGMDGYLKKVNPAFTRVFGYTREELLCTPFINFLHPEEKRPIYQRLKEVAEGQRPRSFPTRCRAKSGEWKWISWTPSEFMEEEGIVQLFGIDITPIKTANLELRKYRHIVESSKDSISLYTLETGEILLNTAFKKFLGYSHSDLKGLQDFKSIYADEVKARDIFSTLLSGKFWEGDIAIRNRKGEVLDYFLSAGPVLNEKKEMLAIFGLHKDISERKAHEEALKEYGGRVTNILESITDGFFSLTRDYMVTYWNKEAALLLKVRKEDILHKYLWDFFPTGKKNLFPMKFEEAFKTGKKIQFEEYLQSLDTWFDVNAYPGKDGLSIYFKDISGRKKIEEEIRIAKERYDFVAKATREAVYDWDIPAGKIEWNKVYYSYYGYKKLKEPESFEQWKRNLHPEDRELVLKNLEDSINSSGNQWDCEYRLIKENRKIAIVLERGFIIRDRTGKAVRMTGSLQDITELKQHERALEELNFKLQQHANELALSNAELEQFAYIASHDLQEPLRMVTSFLNLLEKKYNNTLDDRARQYIHFATDGAVRMRQIILDLLEYSRAGRLNYQTEQIDLNKIMDEIVLLHENLLNESGAKIKYHDLPVIKAGGTPLQRVLSNLITNGIKYRGEKEEPEIEIKVKEVDFCWQISVIDNGIGIEEEFFEKIFIIFQRLHSREKYAGTGIGLAICKKIIENHGGKIWVESIPEKGSIFHFTIPKQF